VTAPGSAGGVFLSYASQDGDAARRICDALRAAGIEVWLDQNELRGGDVWDQKIRRQVRECVLFLAVISSHTQSRKEGYFRLEWRLGVERMHRMSDRATFLLPIVIDKTTENLADVPEAFKSVQWARLPAGDTSRQFVDLVLSLLESSRVSEAQEFASVAPITETPHGSPPRSVQRKPRATLWLMAAAVLAVGVFAAVYFGQRIVGAGRPPVAADTSSPRALSVIVLPFVNQTGDSQKEYIADALTSSITDGMVRIRDVYVVPAQTAYTYKNKALPLQQVAHEAGVAFVLSGNVQAAGAQARIAVQLSRGDGSGTLWNETFAGDLNDWFELQDRVTARVANSLDREMTVAADRDRGKLAEDAETADLLLRAGALYYQNASPEKFDEEARVYRAVLAREPDNARALAGLAISTASRVTWGFYTPKSVERQGELFAEAEKLAARVDEISSGTIAVQDVRGMAAMYRGDFETAERMFNALREQMPLISDPYNALGVLAYMRYEPRKALEFFQRAAELSPGPLPDWFLANNAVAYLQLAEYEAAIENAEKALAVNPRLEYLSSLIALAYSLRGNDAAAETWAAKARAANVVPADVTGFASGSEAYERWADSVFRPTWRKLGLAE
jgi:adenylate cyclase